MDAQRFDELARALVDGKSRRGVLKILAAGLGASVFGFSKWQSPGAMAEVGAACETTEDCDEGEICTGGFCAIENGECVPIDGECGAELECCDGTCVEGTCTPSCIAEGVNCAETPESCCGDLVCAEGVCTAAVICAGEGESCGEIPCCGEELTCFQTVCSLVVCSEEGDPCSEISCCTGTGLVCIEGYCAYEPTCADEKEACESDEDCCSDLVCNDKGYCKPPKEYCGVPGDECEIPDHNCCNGLTCFEGLCDNPSGLCMDNWEYCDGKHFTCCSGLVCGADYFCHPAKKEVPAPVVTYLPSTGSGQGGDDSSWINAAALGGAAAAIGAAYLRAKARENGEEPGT